MRFEPAFESLHSNFSGSSTYFSLVAVLKELNKNPKNFHVKKWKPFPENSLGKIGSLISQCGELKKFLEENGNPGPDLRIDRERLFAYDLGLENNLHEI